MADQYSVFNPTVDLNPYAAQIADIQRRQRMAQLLQQQGMEPIESQVVGNRVVPISPWQVLAKGLQAGLGAYQERQANQAAQDLQDQMQYNQRSQEAENAAAQQAIAGRLFGERASAEPSAPSVTSASETKAAADENAPLEEVTPTAQYKYDPAAAMRIAMTPEGQQALQKNQMLASVLAQSMAKPEPYKYFAQVNPKDFTPESVTAFNASVQSGHPNYSLLQTPAETPKAPSLQHITQTYYDKSGNEIKRDVTFNPATGEVKPIGAAYSGKPATAYDPATISALASRAIAGDKTALTGLGRSPGAMMAIQSEVTKQMQDAGASPTAIIDAQRKLAVQQKTENEFANGAAQRTITAMNTFVQHANTLEKLAQAQQNGDINAINRIRAAWQNQFGEPLPNDINLVSQLVGDELQKAAAGVPGGESERQALKSRFDAAKSPAQMLDALNQARHLVKGQLQSLEQRYKAGGGSQDFANTFLTPDAQALFAPPAASTGAAAGTAPNIQSLLDKYSGKK